MKKLNGLHMPRMVLDLKIKEAKFGMSLYLKSPTLWKKNLFLFCHYCSATDSLQALFLLLAAADKCTRRRPIWCHRGHRWPRQGRGHAHWQGLLRQHLSVSFLTCAAPSRAVVSTGGCKHRANRAAHRGFWWIFNPPLKKKKNNLLKIRDGILEFHRKIELLCFLFFLSYLKKKKKEDTIRLTLIMVPDCISAV